MDAPQIKDLVEKLEVITRLLAHQVTQSYETLEKKAAVLASLGLRATEIAMICDTTPATIRARLAEANKKQRQR